MRWTRLIWALAITGLLAPQAYAGVLEYGDEDVLGTGVYGGDPKAGATLQGLAPGVVTVGAAPLGHGFPFTPALGDYPGTDQIYVGSVQTNNHDGYSVSPPRLNGPQVITLNYSPLVPAGETITSLTLGIAADDFQFPAFGQPFTASINGGADPALTARLNTINQGGPVVQFFTIGIAPAVLDNSNILTLRIDQGGDGGDGWAIDYLTVGVVTTQSVPEPATLALVVVGAGTLVAGFQLRRRRAA